MNNPDCSKTGDKNAAIAFFKKVAEAEKLTSEVSKGDVFNTVRIARSQGFEIGHEDIWTAITELEKNRVELAANIPSWILSKIHVAVHD